MLDKNVLLFQHTMHSYKTEPFPAYTWVIFIIHHFNEHNLQGYDCNNII